MERNFMEKKKNENDSEDSDDDSTESISNFSYTKFCMDHDHKRRWNILIDDILRYAENSLYKNDDDESDKEDVDDLTDCKKDYFVEYKRRYIFMKTIQDNEKKITKQYEILKPINNDITRLESRKSSLEKKKQHDDSKKKNEVETQRKNLLKDLDKVKKNGVDIIAFNSNKDQTDFELALNYLEGVDKSIIYIIGGESGEIDHLLSIFLLIPSKSS